MKKMGDEMSDWGKKKLGADKISSAEESHYLQENDWIHNKTNLKINKYGILGGFLCFFCTHEHFDNPIILAFEESNTLNGATCDLQKWREFNALLYNTSLDEKKNSNALYCYFIIDDDAQGIPIQFIEGDKSYSRKYVVTLDEAEDIFASSNNNDDLTENETIEEDPVHTWGEILSDAHLTACLTQTYLKRNIIEYLSGKPFDSDEIYEDDGEDLTESTIPPVKWVKSLDTTNYRDFCFDNRNFQFGQVNLFYGANGSGKTSILEAIEYALTAQIGRVNDFKVNLEASKFPAVQVYDREAGILTFTPYMAKRNSKEIERVWYGVPTGRTKTTLNEHFSRFNEFDSEAAYKFIHNTDNSDKSFSVMFSNLLFGENVVDYEKNWVRYKRGFEDYKNEIEKNLSAAKENFEYYGEYLEEHRDTVKTEDIEELILSTCLKNVKELSRDKSDRYNELSEKLSLIKPYVSKIKYRIHGDTYTITELEDEIQQIEEQCQQAASRKNKNAISRQKLLEEKQQNEQNKYLVAKELKDQQEIIDSVNAAIKNWDIVTTVLADKTAIDMVEKLTQEQTANNLKLYYISRIERRITVVKFLQLDSYVPIFTEELESHKTTLETLKENKKELERLYAAKKAEHSAEEKKVLELRRLGKKMATGGMCPLCGYRYNNSEELLMHIDSKDNIDQGMDQLAKQINDIQIQIDDNKQIIQREELISKGKEGIAKIVEEVPELQEHLYDYSYLNSYLESKEEILSRNNEIAEQLEALSIQGFSTENIKNCREYKENSAEYRSFINSNSRSSYKDYLAIKLNHNSIVLQQQQDKLNEIENEIQQEEHQIEMLNLNDESLEEKLKRLDYSGNCDLENALTKVTEIFDIDEDEDLESWIPLFDELYDKCMLKANVLNNSDEISNANLFYKEAKKTIKILTPQQERCSEALEVFEEMPHLESFVKESINRNIGQISKYFRLMHHSGEFNELDVDEEGIYAVRNLDNEIVRTYEMSTGQRTAIALASMLSLHTAAKKAPQFLLLDEPLATMDSVQVLNVLDILKSMANEGTQIFFTSANDEMVRDFKECFKDTKYDYKEFEFRKRTNDTSEILESKVNNVADIEQLSLEDLKLDFRMLPGIRETSDRNKKSLLLGEDEDSFDSKLQNESSDSLEATNDQDDEIDEDSEDETGIETAEETQEIPSEEKTEDQFENQLTDVEHRALKIIQNKLKVPFHVTRAQLESIPNYQNVFESINDKSMDFFGETILIKDNKSVLPKISEDLEEYIKDE